METLYDVNGLMFWTAQEISRRQILEKFFVQSLYDTLKTQNRGFEFEQIEAPILTPQTQINKNYTRDDVFVFPDDNEETPGLVLRPETTMGSYTAALAMLNTHNARKYKLPLCVWQHGKSFRREQDQPSKHMRLKEFYQLEFQIIYSSTTANDYSLAVIPVVTAMISQMIGPCRNEPSDRLPDYSESTTDVICEKTNMEVCSISKRKDFPMGSVLEVAIGTDRCVYNMSL